MKTAYHLWEESFSKRFKNGLPSFKVLQKVFEAYNEQRLSIIKQKDLIIKNLDLKNSVLSQDSSLF